MTLTYNLNHLQVAAVGATPTYTDVNGAISNAPAITSDSTDIRGDGSVWATVFSTAGELSMVWLQTNFAVLAIINGGTVSSSGTTPAVIDRYEQGGTYVAPSVIVASWEPNIAPDKSPAEAGLRTTVPKATFGPAVKASGQETAGEWTADGTFKADAQDVMIVYELLETAPTFTAGVMPVVLPV